MEAFSLLKTYNPDLLILDLSLPHLNGLDLLHKIQKRTLDVNVVVLSMHGASQYVQEAFDLGVSGYVLKGSPLEELLEAVDKALQDSSYVSRGVVEKLSEEPSSAEDEDVPFQTLTDRQREVLQLTAEGLTSKEIGEKLHISHRTVEKHREKIKEKLQVKTTVEMATVALRRGLISDPDAPL